jgi:hypothetical protein
MTPLPSRGKRASARGCGLRGFSLKPFDLLITALALGVTVFFSVRIYSGPVRQEELIVKGPGGSWVFPLEAEEQIEVPGPLGTTVVELRAGRARVLVSPCTNQLCVSAGAIHRRGQWIACLPNSVLVTVEGREPGTSGESGGDELDAAAW